MSKKKKTIMLILSGIIALTLLATIIAYFALKPEKPWTAFYIACGGGVLIVNVLISLFFIHKNFK